MSIIFFLLNGFLKDMAAGFAGLSLLPGATVVGMNARMSEARRTDSKVGQNDPCLRGSGKKHKRCGGRQ